ncbi:helix-turn-helix transcriptional regulator (plasmid) [Salmonella enterica subsp. enterica]|nr:helix-turn-helix transcriptional regulator [Salmonella enterica subsp. enterica]
MDLNTAANALRELGHPTRLSIYRELVRAGHEGLPVGELQKHLEIPASTLSHHLSALISAGRSDGHWLAMSSNGRHFG